eukprot:3937119-Rhodomonas_salina.1
MALAFPRVHAPRAFLLQVPPAVRNAPWPHPKRHVRPHHHLRHAHVLDWEHCADVEVQMLQSLKQRLHFVDCPACHAPPAHLQKLVLILHHQRAHFRRRQLACHAVSEPCSTAPRVDHRINRIERRRRCCLPSDNTVILHSHDPLGTRSLAFYAGLVQSPNELLAREVVWWPQPPLVLSVRSQED